jgi:hypothetical protein
LWSRRNIMLASIEKQASTITEHVRRTSLW